MDRHPPSIDAEIQRAETLPGSFYGSAHWHEEARARVFARAWHFLGAGELARVPGQLHPTLLGEGVLDEPVVLVRDRDDELRCLSNVCTHRGALLCEGPAIASQLRCRYHGRRFGLDGRLLASPGFEGATGFPRPEDDLPRLPIGVWRGFLFAALAPDLDFGSWIAPLAERVAFLPVEQAVLDPARSRDYLVHANWALYCDNYLEGFHVPFVHAGLAAAIDCGAYRTELFAAGSLQVGIAAGSEEVFDLPAGHPDAGQRVAAWWFWLFPNLMVNVYPWGISVNVVQPLSADRTRVRFLHYAWDPGRMANSAGSAIDRVEREDEAVVESVQRGTRAALYRRGRYAPAHETGVHHFHRLLVARLAGA
jgi:choline monooxygenase